MSNCRLTHCVGYVFVPVADVNLVPEGHSALSPTQRFELARNVCAARRRGEYIGLREVHQIALAMVPAESKFKASYTFIKMFFAEFGLAGPFVPHFRMQGWFPTEDDGGFDSDDYSAPDAS